MGRLGFDRGQFESGAVVGKRYMHKQISGNRTNYAFA